MAPGFLLGERAVEIPERPLSKLATVGAVPSQAEAQRAVGAAGHGARAAVAARPRKAREATFSARENVASSAGRFGRA